MRPVHSSVVGVRSVPSSVGGSVGSVVRSVVGLGAGSVAIVAVLAACGGSQKPKQPDLKALAATLDADLKQLNAIAIRLEGQCEPLLAELQPHVAKMRAHVDEVKTTMNDPELGPELKREVRAYDQQQQAALFEATGESLGKSYLACNQDKRLLQLVDQIPVLE